MPRRRLHNDDWGLASNCFVCEAKNDAGLRLEVFADDDRKLVEADVRLGDAFSGAPAVVHGGITLAVLDEVQAWAVIALGQQWAVTTETGATFQLPVWVDHPYRAVGRIVSHEGDRFTTTGQILDPDDRICVESRSVFQAIGEATATAITGTDIPEQHRDFLRRE